MKKIFKYLLMLNVCLALASLLGSAWAARAVGSEAYLAGAIAMASVGVAASLALLLSFLQSRQSSTGGGVSSVLLAMFVRMGLPMGVLLVMQGLHSPLLEAGFMGLLVLNYLVALPLETLMSLKLLRESNPKGSITKVSGRAVSG